MPAAKKPDATEIPFGLSSKLMALVASVFAVITAITTVTNGELTQDSIVTLIISATSLFVLAGGRYAQAALQAFAKHLS